MLNCLFEKWYNDLVRVINAWTVKKILTFTSLIPECTNPINFVNLVFLLAKWFCFEVKTFKLHPSIKYCM